MTYLGNADEIRVESDERGFELHISTDQGDYVVNVHGVADELYDAVKGAIGPWLAEGEAARHSVRVDHYDGAGYALDDPKHPDYLAGADMLRDRARGK